MKRQCRYCLMTDDIALIDDSGECEYCKLHEKLEGDASARALENHLNELRKHGKNKKYDCLIGISGGFDSSLLLEYAVKKWELKPLVIHFDNGWNEPFAESNITAMITRLNVDFIRYYVDREEYDNCCKAFLFASVPDADIPNDIIMTKLMYKTARQYGIKYILNGHCFRTEGSTPRPWTYMDAKYIRSVYKSFTGREIKNLPLLTIRDQIIYGLMGIKHIRPFHHMRINRLQEMTRLQENYGYKKYDLKHAENVYTAFIGYYLLPLKFKIDKRRVYLSAMIRSSITTKDKATEALKQPTNYFIDEFLIMRRLGISYTQFEAIMQAPLKSHNDYGHYNFKRYRILFWFLVKMNILPYTFYYKYCK